jgi:hypothetical protein
MTQFGQASKRPSYQFGQVNLDLFTMVGWSFICKVTKYLTNHFDLQIMNHLVS